MDCIIIGIAGGTGSGKSAFTNRLKKHFGDDITIIYYDNYYRCHDELPFEEREKLNYDTPEALESDLLARHLRDLKNGKSIMCPVYDFSMHNRSHNFIEIKPSRIIIVEGMLVLADDQLRNQFDVRIYVDSDADIVINGGHDKVAFDLVVSLVEGLTTGTVLPDSICQRTPYWTKSEKVIFDRVRENRQKQRTQIWQKPWWIISVRISWPRLISIAIILAVVLVVIIIARL